MSEQALVLPGDALGPAADFTGSCGTYERAGVLYASRVGLRSSLAGAAMGQRPVLSVFRLGGPGAELVTLSVGCIVTARVGRVTPLMAHAEILLVDGRPLPEPAAAVIRRENVRDSEIDKLDMLEAFRPSDIVKAAVVSLGDARSFYLSTAEPHLGVIYAVSEGGSPLVPHPTEPGVMHLPGVAGKHERRKVAR